MTARADGAAAPAPRRDRDGDDVGAAVASAVSTLDDEAIAAFARDAKIGLLATVDAGGLPHVTLITSLQAKGPHALTFGQFTEGASKAHLTRNPNAAFLVMTRERALWRGTARWTHARRAGEDYELYNRKPMFRYNAYFGIHTVHYLDLIRVGAKETLSPARLTAGTAALALARPLLRTRSGARALTPWATRHLAKVTTLKFLAWVGDDGYPVLAPPVACRAVDAGHLAFRAPAGWLDGVTSGQRVAVFALNLEMESVLVRGRFRGWRHAGPRTGAIEIDWVYNSMPPKPGQIYPPLALEPVTAFAPRAPA